jgi:hypothetical protein
MEPGSGEGTAMTFPMSPLWRGLLWALVGLGLVAALSSAAELAGLAERDALLRGAADAERWVALVVGAAMILFGWSAARHARMTLDDEELSFLRFGLLCGTARVPLRRIRRFGEGWEQNRGRRQRVLLLELDDGSRPAVKLAMYTGQDRLLAELGARLGQEPAPTKTTFLGARFEDEE